MKKTLLTYSIIVLIILVGYLLIYTQKSKLSVYNAPSPTPIPSSTVLTADQKFILAPPPADSSATLRQKHAQIVKKLAVDSQKLSLTNCKPDPLVLQIKQGQTLWIKNNDNTTHELMFDENHSLNLKPNSEASISAKFKYGTGDYGYICKGSGLVGFLHII